MNLSEFYFGMRITINAEKNFQKISTVHNVKMTLYLRRSVVRYIASSVRRHFDVMCMQGYLSVSVNGLIQTLLSKHTIILSIMIIKVM